MPELGGNPARSLLPMSKSGGWENYLRDAMSAAKIPNAAELSRLTGVNESQISRWLRGVGQPDVSNLRRLSPALNIPILELLVAAGHITSGEAKIRDVQPPQRIHTDVITAIREDEKLIPEAREHLERQYGLLSRLHDESDTPSAVPLRRVARKRTPPARPS